MYESFSNSFFAFSFINVRGDTALLTAGLVIDQGTCDVAGRLASYLNSSCVPGLADELYINEMVRNKLCANCESNDCSRGSGYYGYSGALK